MNEVGTHSGYRLGLLQTRDPQEDGDEDKLVERRRMGGY